MCGRFFIAEDDPSEELKLIIQALNRRGNVGGSVKTSGEIFPTDTVPVVANSRSMMPTTFAMQWGYRMDKRLLINARSETAADKPLFRDGLLQRRCLIPATHYFEWERHGRDKTKYAIRSAEPGLIYMAGIYRIRDNRPEFLILTRASADSISFIHDRMPVLLPKAAQSDWLNLRKDPGEALRAALLSVEYQPA